MSGKIFCIIGHFAGGKEWLDAAMTDSLGTRNQSENTALEKSGTPFGSLR